MKRIIIGIMIICIFTVTGCKNTSDTELKEEIVQVSSFENTEYNLETDYQYYFSDYIEAVLAEDGYYIVTGGMLCFFDKASGKVILVCSKIDCNHKYEECDAYVDNVYCLSYYEQELYYVLSESSFVDSTRDYVLYKKALDGSVAEEICCLATVSADGNSVMPETIVHRGYVYYSLMESEKKCTLFRVPIDGKGDIETLYTAEGYDAVIYKLKGYGDGVAFISSAALDSEYSEFEYNLYYYDSNEEKVKSIMQDKLRGEYLIHDNKIYYTLADGIYCYDAIENKDEKFFETDSLVYMSFDGNYFYFDNAFGIGRGTVSEDNHNISVVSLEGELIDTIHLEEVNLCLFGDSDYMFRDVADGLIMFDKDQIGTGSHEWVELPIAN